jgi:2-oxoglutarate/2-oxoacid ferredoxin oxidoreductase subunit alpha
MEKEIIKRDHVVVKFAGDSGDGIQLTGTQLSDTSAFVGEDVSTFPDYPAEIRAPQGSVSGVSGFQLHFGKRVFTPGDKCDFLIALNPAALKANIQLIKDGGTIIVDMDSFTNRFMDKAGLSEDELNSVKTIYNFVQSPIGSMVQEVLKDSDMDLKFILKTKNMFSLGMIFNIFSYPLDYTINFLNEKFKNKPKIAKANIKVLKAGYSHAHAIQLLPSYRVEPAKLSEGLYRNISGNTATAWGLLAAAEKAGLDFFLGSYPITPASEILEEIARRKDTGAKAFQAEDEIGGIVSAIGAAFAGNLVATSTSGPGLALKAEAIGLAVMTELPLVIIDAQRGGPSTGLPTKTEQGDLLQAIFGRNGESHVPVIAASSPSNCFYYAYYAAKIALEHMTPVILLTDSFLANGSEPSKITLLEDLPEIKTKLVSKNEKQYLPYQRDENLVRNWAIPGMKGFEHRIGGLEKADIIGNVSYTPENHEKMTALRKQKVMNLSAVFPDLKVENNHNQDILVAGWGSTYGHIHTAINELKEEGINIAQAHFNFIYPLPKNTGEVLSKFKKIIVFELNMGQFYNYLKMNHSCHNVISYTKVQGIPLNVDEIKEEIKRVIKI